MTIVITGISGSIGRVLHSHLSNVYDIYGIDIKGAQGDTILNCDISDAVTIRDTFGQLPKIDCIIHLAADHSPEA